MSRYGDVIEVGAVLGEGGEFETLAIDGPAPLWKSSIVVDDEDISVLPGDGGSATLSITKAKSLEKNTPSAEEDIKVRTPELLDTEFMQLRRRFGELKDGLSRHPKQLESRSVRGRLLRRS